MDTWWIDEPRLLGSANPSDADLERLWREGFGVLVSLLAEDTETPGYDVGRATALGFTRFNIPVKDFQPPAPGQLERFLSLIADLPVGARIIVHCQGGSGRTGTFAAAHWVAKGLTPADAMARVRKAWPHAIETQEQEAALTNFAASRKPPEET